MSMMLHRLKVQLERRLNTLLADLFVFSSNVPQTIHCISSFIPKLFHAQNVQNTAMSEEQILGVKVGSKVASLGVYFLYRLILFKFGSREYGSRT